MPFNFAYNQFSKIGVDDFAVEESYFHDEFANELEKKESF
jgi:hypothetical protein